MRNLKLTLFTLFVLLCPLVKAQTHNRDEIIYHLFERSFYDSNGDQHGDLNGIYQKLDYLQQIGVTSILLTPLYNSVFYHNYFATSFYDIDPKYGTLRDYLRLVKELHRRHMKIYLDMETQYVAEDHIWFKDAYKNPKSKYSYYIEWTDKTNNEPISIVGGYTQLEGYDGVVKKLVMVNLDNKAVQDFNYRFFKFWVDPNNDGKFDDGVDGFRLDHMMDNLDFKDRLPHLFDTFWKPLLSKLRKVNPALKIVAEQANWGSFGIDYLKNAGVDRVFGFRMAFAIRNLKKTELEKVADSTFLYNPQGKQQLVFIENHDMPRYRHMVKGDTAKLKIGAALNLLLGGIPSIYYGQEIGMNGASISVGPTDANELPDRQAFEWYKSDEGKGMAYWYKVKGPWKDKFNDDLPNDGISLEEERNDPNSLWNYYRALIKLRKNNRVLISGVYKTLQNDNAEVYSFLRYEGDKKIVVAVNLSGSARKVQIQFNSTNTKAINLWGKSQAVLNSGNIQTDLQPFGVSAWQIE